MDQVQSRSPVLVRQFAPSRRQRNARTRAAALTVIAAVAVSGALLQELQMRASMSQRGIDVATAPTPPGPFDYFPG